MHFENLSLACRLECFGGTNEVNTGESSDKEVKLSRDVWSGLDNSTGIPDHHDDNDKDNDKHHAKDNDKHDDNGKDKDDVFHLDSTSWIRYPVRWRPSRPRSPSGRLPKTHSLP